MAGAAAVCHSPVSGAACPCARRQAAPPAQGQRPHFPPTPAPCQDGGAAVGGGHGADVVPGKAWRGSEARGAAAVVVPQQECHSRAPTCVQRAKGAQQPRFVPSRPSPLSLIRSIYQGVKYNIPVAVWLPERYPLAAPLVYVVPTPDMVIKPRHSFVDASGARPACSTRLHVPTAGALKHVGAASPLSHLLPTPSFYQLLQSSANFFNHPPHPPPPGLVNTLYIGQWQYPTSNLRDMAQVGAGSDAGDARLGMWSACTSRAAGDCR